MFAKQLSPILTLSDKMAIKNLVPKEQDKVPVTQLRWMMDLRNRDQGVRDALGIEGQQTWEEQLAWYKGFIFDHKSAIYMIHYGSNFAGYLNFTALDLKGRHTEIGIKMTEAYRGQGIGRQAFEFWCDMLTKYYNLNKLYLWVREHNLPAIGLYESMGFVETGRHKAHFYDDESGHWSDYILMSLYHILFTPSTIEKKDG